MKSISTQRILGFVLVSCVLTIALSTGAQAAANKEQRKSAESFLSIVKSQALQARSAIQAKSRKLLQAVTFEELGGCETNTPICQECAVINVWGLPCWDVQLDSSGQVDPTAGFKCGSCQFFSVTA